jgi:hypothetical protein
MANSLFDVLWSIPPFYKIGEILNPIFCSSVPLANFISSSEKVRLTHGAITPHEISEAGPHWYFSLLL